MKDDSPVKVNLIRINWVDGAKTLNFVSACWNVHNVGAYVGRFVNDLLLKKKTTLDKIVLVGHSLGSHVVGCGMISFLLRPLNRMFIYLMNFSAGRWLKEKKYTTLPIIIALDPVS